MRRRYFRHGSPGFADAAVALLLGLVLLGALAWFRPYLTRKQPSASSVPAPTALLVVSQFPVSAHREACMNSVAIEPDSRLAEFQLHPAKLTPGGGPAVDLVLSGPGYRSVNHIPGGYPGGGVSLAITPPPHAVIGTACFINRGTTTLLLAGSTEPRTVSRSATVVAGRRVLGDIALAFSDNRPRSLLDRLGEIFGHASNLTDHLVPVWLIWILAVLVGLGVPCGIAAALYLALREDAAPTGA
jgi:hypothetical protein